MKKPLNQIPKITRQRMESEKATAHHYGVSARRGGRGLDTNPHSGKPGQEHQAHAWERGWRGEDEIQATLRGR